MAIQVGGTTVINNSRELQGITGADTTTKNSLAAAGIGGGAEWQTVATSTLDTNTRQEYTSPAISVTMPNWEDLQGFGMELSFDAYRASPDGYTGYITLYLPSTDKTPSSSNAFYMQFYRTFTSSEVNTWHTNQKVFAGYELTSRYDLAQNSSGGAAVYYNYSDTNRRYSTRSSGTIFAFGGTSGYHTILSSDLNPGQSFNIYYKANDGYTNFRIRNAQMKFLAKYR